MNFFFNYSNDAEKTILEQFLSLQSVAGVLSSTIQNTQLCAHMNCVSLAHKSSYFIHCCALSMQNGKGHVGNGRKRANNKNDRMMYGWNSLFHTFSSIRFDIFFAFFFLFSFFVLTQRGKIIKFHFLKYNYTKDYISFVLSLFGLFALFSCCARSN